MSAFWLCWWLVTTTALCLPLVFVINDYFRVDSGKVTP